MTVTCCAHQSTVPEEVEEVQPATSGATAPMAGMPEAIQVDEYAEKLKAIPAFKDFGPLFRSCEPVLLTEEDTEYTIKVVKHVFQSHIVFQFNCMNTIEEQVLENVRVIMDLAEAVSDWWKQMSARRRVTAGPCSCESSWTG